MRKPLSDYVDDPMYNMKAVEQQTQIPAATLRAWERRYGLIEPKRTPTGYRLYSDRDVALLRWVRSQMDTGLTISRVVVMLEAMRVSDEPIWVDLDDQRALINSNVPLPLRSLAPPLFEALKALDEERADEIMEQAFALYTTSTVYIEIVAATLAQVGDAWHRREIFTTIEHFATAYLRGRLLTLLQAYLPRPDMPRLLTAAPLKSVTKSAP